MEFFTKTGAVKLRSHLKKYLVADDDKETVRQSRQSASTHRSCWIVEPVDSNSHVIRLKSCHGRYLTASTVPLLLGMTGKIVTQSIPENPQDLSMEWQPIQDALQVKLRSSVGTLLRANGAIPPWRNKVTHDENLTGPTHNWTLWDVVPVDVPEDGQFTDCLSKGSSLSSVSNELSGQDFGSPVSVHSELLQSERTQNLVEWFDP